MKIERKNSGVCSRSISFDIDENHVVTNVSFVGGCNGNLQGVSALCDGMTAEEIIKAENLWKDKLLTRTFGWNDN